jgi:hypothetical protein
VRNTTFAAFVPLIAALGLACSGASSTLGSSDSGPSGSSSGGGSGGSSGGGPTDSGGGGDSAMGSEAGGACNPTPPDDGACNSLAPSGPLVPYECISATIPTAEGGTIVNGTYLLTASAFYGTPCPTPENDRDTWLVCGTTWQTAQEYTVGTTMPTLNFLDANVTPMGGPNLSLQFACGLPMIETVTFQYTATPTTLILFVGGGMSAGMGRVDTYTLQ